MRRAVLGIDAAWTAAAPSGVALVVEGERGWTCAGLAPGYGRMKRDEDALARRVRGAARLAP